MQESQGMNKQMEDKSQDKFETDEMLEVDKEAFEELKKVFIRVRNNAKTTSNESNCESSFEDTSSVKWDNISLQEKVERLRGIVKTQRDTLQYYVTMLNRINADFYTHQHYKDKIFRNITRQGNSYDATTFSFTSPASNSDDWF